ncbi:hypothetical protein CG709_02215, partial [Lachnotalea glycerini]
DWNIVGFFTDKLQAEKYCQFMNDKYPHENYEVCELENLNENIDLSLIYPKYTFTFNGKFNDYWENVQGSLAVNGEKNEVRENKNGYADNKYMIKVVTTEKDRNKAAKIAQDMFAKYKAEKAGL